MSHGDPVTPYCDQSDAILQSIDDFKISCLQAKRLFTIS